MQISCSRNIYYHQCWKLLLHIFVETVIYSFFFRILINRNFKITFIWTEIFCTIINAFTATFDQFNASWLNRSIIFFLNGDIFAFRLNWILAFHGNRTQDHHIASANSTVYATRQALKAFHQLFASCFLFFLCWLNTTSFCKPNLCCSTNLSIRGMKKA